MKTIKKFEDYKLNESAPNAELENAFCKTSEFKKYAKQISDIVKEAEKDYEKFCEENDYDPTGKDESLTWNFVVQNLTGMGEYY